MELVLPVGLIVLWWWAYSKTVAVFGLNARLNFFILLIVVIMASVIGFFVFVYPNLDCKENFCEFVYILPWLGIALLLVLLPPILMLLRAYKNEWNTGIPDKESKHKKANRTA